MTREEAKVFMLQFNTDKRLNPSEHEAVRVAIQALSQEPICPSAGVDCEDCPAYEPCDDWYDVPSDEMTLEQARQAVKDLRNKLAEYLEQEPSDTVSRGVFEQVMRERDIAIEQLHELGYELGQKIEPLEVEAAKLQQAYNKGFEDCRQAAIDAIKKIHPVDTEYDCTLYDKLDVMYVLKELPPIIPQQKVELYEDAVSREKALEPYKDLNDDDVISVCLIKKNITELPSVTPQSKTGHWIHFAQSDDCSECGWSTGKYISPSNYCPNCGARMVEPQESEEV